MARIYAGIGSRKTPADILMNMTSGARQLAEAGWLLRSGHAHGADLAFEAGARERAEIHLPWPSYNDQYNYGAKYIVPIFTPEIVDIAKAHHPAWDRLSYGGRLMMYRNVTIILGSELQSHAEVVICWTPGARLVGGTAHGIRVAQAHGIPVFNLASKEQLEALNNYMNQ